MSVKSPKTTSNDAEQESTFGAIVVGVLLLLGVLVFLVGSCVRQFNGAAEREREQEAQERAEQAAESAESRRKGFHCLSGWDGSLPDAVKQVKGQLRDPSSFEHMETSVWPVDSKGMHEFHMTYRAANGFGGMVVESVVGSFRNDDCQVE